MLTLIFIPRDFQLTPNETVIKSTRLIRCGEIFWASCGDVVGTYSLDFCGPLPPTNVSVDLHKFGFTLSREHHSLDDSTKVLFKLVSTGL